MSARVRDKKFKFTKQRSFNMHLTLLYKAFRSVNGTRWKLCLLFFFFNKKFILFCYRECFDGVS